MSVSIFCMLPGSATPESIALAIAVSMGSKVLRHDGRVWAEGLTLDDAFGGGGSKTARFTGCDGVASSVCLHKNTVNDRWTLIPTTHMRLKSCHQALSDPSPRKRPSWTSSGCLDRSTKNQ